MLRRWVVGILMLAAAPAGAVTTDLLTCSLSFEGRGRHPSYTASASMGAPRLPIAGTSGFTRSSIELFASADVPSHKGEFSSEYFVTYNIGTASKSGQTRAYQCTCLNYQILWGDEGIATDCSDAITCPAGNLSAPGWKEIPIVNGVPQVDVSRLKVDERDPFSGSRYRFNCKLNGTVD